MLWKTTRIPAGQLNKALSASQNVLVNTEEREEEKERERERESKRHEYQLITYPGRNMLRFLKIAKFEIVILIFGEVLSKIIAPSQLMLAASILKTFPEFWSL